MTPTLSGRIQTRVALLALVGVPWTMLLAPVLPGGVRLGHALASLLVIAVLGVGWELLYHGCQQLRRDRDWPSLFALAAGVAEGAAAWPVLRTLGLAPRSALGYAVLFGTMWLLIWLVTQGPIRVLAPRWRYTGGRLLTHGLRRLGPALGASGAAKTTSGRARPAAGAAWAVVGLVSLLTLSGSTGLAPHGPSGVGPDRDLNDAEDRVEPVSLTVPRIAASSMLMRLELDAAGDPETPPAGSPTQAGWYALGPAPGQTGPAVIVGHVDGGWQPGIFFRLGELVPGDEILIGRADSSVLRFVVTRTQRTPAAWFPTAKVDGRELRLVTCGGSTGTPDRDNVIVFAALDTGGEPAR